VAVDAYMISYILKRISPRHFRGIHSRVSCNEINHAVKDAGLRGSPNRLAQLDEGISSYPMNAHARPPWITRFHAPKPSVIALLVAATVAARSPATG